ncbi:MAG: hypothetical protein ACLF0P_09250 [Thermoanaerobaculia bacterium]
MPAEPAEPAAREARRPGLRAALLFGLPTLAILAAMALPLILGRQTLVLRDVLQVHLMLKAPQAFALGDGALPLIDVFRSGGQPLAGNPNAVPFYPDTLLYAVAPVLWALNAHFWIHLLLAPVTAFWMARAWGLPRPAAWACGVCFATSGYFLSQLNFYNLVAGAALAPALVAAALRSVEDPGARRRGRYLAALGGLWALVLLSGDPFTAVVAGALAATAALVRTGRRLLRWRTGGALALATLGGTLVALPQIVEFLRILPASYRGHWGYGDWRLSVGVWRPEHALDWLIPLPFGRYDLRGVGGLWGAPLFEGNLPIFLSLYPGILALGLLVAGGRPAARGAWWGWGSVATGIFLASGGTHTVGRLLFELPGAQAFRYPVKFWLAVALGASLLCGIGWQRVFGDRPLRLRRLVWPVAAIALLLAAAWAFVVFAPTAFEGMIATVGGEDWSPELAGAERGRWIATLVTLGGVLAALGLGLLLASRRPVLAGALLLAIHAAAQVHLLRGLTARDDLEHYAEPSPVLAAIPAGARVAHGSFFNLFGPTARPLPPDHRFFWTIRQDVYSLVPGAGVLHGGLRYELNRSPEGLSSFLSRAVWEAVAHSPDPDRIRALSSWGVEYVVLERPLRDVDPALARRLGTWPGITTPVFVYRLPRAAPDVLLAESELRVPHLNAAWDLLREPAFDPDLHAVLPGEHGDGVPTIPEGPPPPQGQVRVLASGPESLEVETDSPVPAVVVAQRSLLPVWRGTVDGAPVELEPANLYRIGVPVPAGRHRVRLWVDRTPLRWSFAASALGALGLAGWALGAGRRRREPEQVERPAEDA